MAARLPVFPRCAAEVIRASRDGCMASEQVIRLSKTDQVLAGSLIKAANSAAYTWSGSVSTIEHAVLYLGEIRATQVLLSSALRPVLVVSGHDRLWEHSIDVAHIVQRIGERARGVNLADMYVLGLLHDVGELLLRLVPASLTEAMLDYQAEGHSRADAQVRFCGATHAEAGADILRHWGLPYDYAEAIEFHHRPEACSNNAAALLYLAEQWTDSDGDRLCEQRLDLALNALGLRSLDDILGGSAPAKKAV